MSQEVIQNEILGRLYNDWYVSRTVCRLDDIRAEKGSDENLFERAVTDLEYRHFIKVFSGAGFYRIAGSGAIWAEEHTLVPKELISGNRSARWQILDILGEAEESRGPHEGAELQDLCNRTRLYGEDIDAHLQILFDLGYATARVIGEIQITRAGMNLLRLWREKKTVVDEYERVREMSPQPRGRALQQVIAKALGRDGWSQEEGVRASHEEIDVILWKDREYYLIECKWESFPIEAEVIFKLHGKLSNRIDVRGIVVSMSGFTRGTINQIKDYANQRVILPFGSLDVEGILFGRYSFEDLLNQKYRLLITRKIVHFDGTEL